MSFNTKKYLDAIYTGSPIPPEPIWRPSIAAKALLGWLLYDVRYSMANQSGTSDSSIEQFKRIVKIAKTCLLSADGKSVSPVSFQKLQLNSEMLENESGIRLAILVVLKGGGGIEEATMLLHALYFYLGRSSKIEASETHIPELFSRFLEDNFSLQDKELRLLAPHFTEE